MMPFSAVASKVSDRLRTASAYLVCMSSMMLFGQSTTSSKDVPRQVSPVLFRISQNGKVGFIDKQGVLRLSPQFEMAGDPSEGLISVLDPDSDKIGFINLAGNQVISPQFDEVRSFSEGLAAVRTGKTWGFIDTLGKYVISPTFNAAGSMHSGLARVAFFDNFSCPTGSVLDISEAPDELFVFPDEKNNRDGCTPNMRAGYVSALTGQITTPGTHFSQAYDFSEGFGRVVLKDNIETAFLSTSGDLVFRGFLAGSDFSEGLAAIQTSDGWSYIDQTGSFAFDAKFRSVKSFSEGMAAVESDEGKCGYVDTRGNFFIAPRFDACEPYSDGRALVSRETELNPDEDTDTDQPVISSVFLDIRGRLAFNRAVVHATSFQNGLATIQELGKTVYIDQNGHEVSPVELPAGTQNRPATCTANCHN